jgi:hypothetical protein
VIRLVRQFVDTNGSDGMSLQKMKRVGRLIDKYLREISPDQNLKISKFLGVAECLPDSARDCFDGVYRAIDIYLEVNFTCPSSIDFHMHHILKNHKKSKEQMHK